jgi:von Willebrand factor type A domain
VQGQSVRPGVPFTAPERSPWTLSFAAPDVPVAAAGSDVLAVGLCRPEAPAELPLPSRLVFVIDRSRSVGGEGLALQRKIAEDLLQALPPSLRFNVVLFDRTATTLFPSFREATREALGELASALAPGQLHNGTQLGEALRMGSDLLGRGQGSGWLVVLTDGAIALDEVEPSSLPSSLPRDVPVAALAVRPARDEALSGLDFARLASAVSTGGGIARPDFSDADARRRRGNHHRRRRPHAVRAGTLRGAGRGGLCRRDGRDGQDGQQ